MGIKRALKFYGYDYQSFSAINKNNKHIRVHYKFGFKLIKLEKNTAEYEAAKENIILENIIPLLQLTAKIDESTLDEAPLAYKDLTTVINRQAGIVIKVVNTIEPLINIKG